MSSVTSERPCPVCGKQAEADLNCNTKEQEIFCRHCGFLAATELVTSNGKQFWEETKRFPVDADGKVQRGKLQMQSDREAGTDDPYIALVK